MLFNKVTPEIVSKLKKIVGEEHVLLTPEDLFRYSLDETENRYRNIPEVVVRPRTAYEIALIMQLANQHLIPVTPRGAGTGLSGGAVPVYGGILISFERMNQILEIDEENMMVVVEPGVILGDMMKEVEKHGLFYPVDVSSLESCSVGGTVAENAGGARAVKYGLTNHWVCGLEIVTPQGEVVQLGGKRIKDVTGYNLIQLILGSEGTLAIITKIIFRLTTKPKFVLDLLVPFDSLEIAVKNTLKLLQEEPSLAALEFMDQVSIQASERYLNVRLPYDECACHLLLEIDGMDEEFIWRTGEQIYRKLKTAGAKEVFVADNRVTRERIWRARREIAEALKALNRYISVEDIVVPRANIPEMVQRLNELSQKHNLQLAIYGHIGDGNLHPTPLSGERDEEIWVKDLESFLEDMFVAVKELGGNITAEHGVGLKRIKYLSLVLEGPVLALMKAIKQAWDPNNVLNPGKAIL